MLLINASEAKVCKSLPVFFSQVRALEEDDLSFLSTPTSPLLLGKIRSGSNALDFDVVIDGEKFYHTDINDALAYELVKECFNNGGIDNYKGTCLTYIEWKTCYKIYAFDLSRQQALEHNPKKAQTLRFQCTLPAGDYKVIFIASCSKETTFDFMKPSNIKTI